MVTTLVNGKVVASSKVVLPPTTELKAESGEKEAMQHQHSLVVVSEESADRDMRKREEDERRAEEGGLKEE